MEIGVRSLRSQDVAGQSFVCLRAKAENGIAARELFCRQALKLAISEKKAITGWMLVDAEKTAE